MQVRKLGPLMLSGLMVGPVLGSGIFILPPLALELAGDWALPAWMVIVAINAVFAFVFCWLAVLFPGDGGVANAVEHAFGRKMKQFTAYCLLCAVLFGPCAVLLTMVEYLPVPVAEFGRYGREITAFVFLSCGCLLLLQKVRALGTVAFVCSSLGAVLLSAGALAALTDVALMPAPLPEFDAGTFGRTLLLLFWCIIGWEVAGNYSGDVDRPETTMPRAVLISVLVVTLVELLVAGGMQYAQLGSQHGPGVLRLLHPLLGAAGVVVGSLIVFGLCATTYMMFVGAVARLAASLGSEGLLPEVISRKNTVGAPAAAVAVLFLVAAGVATLPSLVVMANGFLIANALVGVAAAVKVLKAWWHKVFSVLLAIVMLVLLAQSELWILLLIGLLGLAIAASGKLLGSKALRQT
ncbi:APC family permease [Oleidesulfovibrio sp.]|uniref:APC family permease n=1 Tax=Oleidesulfovibrio sp. TaxID=2909707 RepID=UPI003A845AD1